MSLRSRLLTAIIAVNLLVLVGMFFQLRSEQERARRESETHMREVFEKEMPNALRNFAEVAKRGDLTIEGILDFGNFGVLCEDAVLVDILSGLGSEPRLFAQCNPLGAWHRDAATFPRTAVLDGVYQAMEKGETTLVHGGYCIPIATGAGRVVGGGWFLPRGQVEFELPVVPLALTLGIGVLLLSAFTYVGMSRWVLGPLVELSEAATALELGELGRQLPERRGAHEVTALVRGFNRASTVIHEHQDQLACAVEAATARARRRERELVLSQRLAALGTLAAGIAHEINNPLAGMLNAVNRLKKKGISGQDKVYIDLLDEGLERIRAIARRALEFAPRASGAVPFRLRDAIERARALVAHRLVNEKVEFGLEGCDDDFVRGDAHEMSQVFLNLFLNSLDALDESLTGGRRLDVSITAVDGDEGEPLVRVVVSDNGPGADPDTIAHIFDPFFSTKGATSASDTLSTGLGMSISFSIVKQHGGVMRVSSPEEGGFRVEVDLPRSTEQSE